MSRIHTISTGKWWGCNWPTSFSPLQLNLENVRARQAKLLAEATSGKESDCWHAATRYLTQVELDASIAEQLAAEALHCVSLGQWPQALKLIEDAMNLEAKYRPSETWNQLRDAIAWVSTESDNHERSVSAHDE